MRCDSRSSSTNPIRRCPLHRSSGEHVSIPDLVDCPHSPNKRIQRGGTDTAGGFCVRVTLAIVIVILAVNVCKRQQQLLVDGDVSCKIRPRETPWI
mmetsp:Transcript_23833/g.27461  ORF Transcript_23833/g.27461 Transcript_23833/m.27461 type:complete len:96 (-) Transcript_23833:402-689(-)